MSKGAIRTKSVYAPIQPRIDGLRILATRIRGRGLPADRYNVWMPNLAPSYKLLQEYRDDHLTWREFSAAYRLELFDSAAFDLANELNKNRGQRYTLRLLQHLASSQPITLLCHCPEDQDRCHRNVLKRILEAKV